MAPWIDTAALSPATPMSPGDRHQVYCGLDSAVTLEVHGQLSQLYNQPPQIYNFERALQAPYLEIMQRGFAIDQQARYHATNQTTARIEALQQQLNEFANAVWDRPVNPRSPKQLKELFYQKMNLPEQWISKKGERKLSMDREVLEKN